jgi:molecular chaperone HtpG
MFESTKTEPGAYVSLKEYTERMPEAQKDIYYITGMTRQAVESSPHLEIFRSKGYEVLFMLDPVDEWVVQSLTEFGSKKLRAVDRGDVEIGSEEEKKEHEAKKEELSKQFKDLLGFIQEMLKDRVKEVRLSNRLTDSACCLVADEYGLNANMERILKSMNQEIPESKRVLELNPEHPIMQVLAEQFEKDRGNGRLSDYCELLFDQALLTEGSPIRDPLRFTKLVSELMVEAAKKLH